MQRNTQSLELRKEKLEKIFMDNYANDINYPDSINGVIVQTCIDKINEELKERKYGRV